MTEHDPPPIYDDLESGNSLSSPYRASSSTWTTLRSHLSSTPSTSQNYIPMANIPAQKPSERMLTLATTAATGPERMAAIAAVPQLLAEEEKTRQALAIEAQQKAEQSWLKTAAVWDDILPIMNLIIGLGLVVGFIFFTMWIVHRVEWPYIEGYFVALFALIILGGGVLFAKYCVFIKDWKCT